jgi:two-component system phosphate regulon sensor histidine kinase PhoR
VKSSVFLKLLAAFFAVILGVTLILDLQIRKRWDESLRFQIADSLQHQAMQFALRVDHEPAETLAQMVDQAAAASGAGVTVIDRTGKVLADSVADPARMENHSQRSEFAAALRGEIGQSTRRSEAAGIDFLYTAAPTHNGAVRFAYPLSAIEKNSSHISQALIRGSLIALLLAVLLAAAAAVLISRRLERIVSFAERVAAGNLSARIDVQKTDEIARVAMALNATAERLEHSFAEVEASRQQLEAVLNSMQAPVIAVNREEKIEWVNGAMNRLLPNRVRLHAPFLETIREPDLLFSVRETIQKRQIHTARARIVPGRTYEATVAPMLAGSAVVLLHDLTEVERERKRDAISSPTSPTSCVRR